MASIMKGLRYYSKVKRWQGVIGKNFLGGGTTKKCDHNCNQALTKSSWGSLLIIHILVSSCFGYIRVSL